MRRWFKVAVPLGIAAVMLSVLAIGFGSTNSHAAKPGAETVTVEGCMGEEPESAGYQGTAASTVEYGFTFCSDESLGLRLTLQWSNSKKDLALRVTEPDGTVHFIDNDIGVVENFVLQAPLDEGDWTIEVINNGHGKVKFGLLISLWR